VLFSYWADVAGEDLWQVRRKWLDFPMQDGVSHVYDRFKKGSGWHGLWVRDLDGEYWPLGSFDLFIGSEVLVKIDANGDDREKPYLVNISAKGTQDETDVEP
jgi:hypothetical protein